MTVSRIATEWALRMGWRVFPTREKKPLIKWKDEASSDPEAIASMPWDGADGYGVALDQGSLVVDLDATDTGDLTQAVTSLRDHLPSAFEVFQSRRAFMVSTPSGGLHLYFRYDPELDIPQTSWPHLDLRVGGKGYVIGPGTRGYDVVAWGESDIRLSDPLVAIPQSRVVPFLAARRR